ncbi:interleukin-17 receptor D isoform X4 [Gymnodraco acuticeps]|uniref:Interleukin-17 receptor D isoform X4 n=1 Tax=Gymnodraco acuticeps TaxID=8218 RepID=A0A6P8SNQ4_GYMAC|nr:interleukin-17 receptor D isoform X4 [Gymnodraco acuticeps]
MWTAALVVFLFSAPCQHVWAQEGAITPQDCSLDCIKEGGPGCEYCRITRADVKTALGFNSFKEFGRIAFLRGFQVSLQALGGSSFACQLFLFHRNLSLPASQSKRVYKSDPFPGLPLGSQYAVTVMALPVPEEWERFYRSRNFSSRSCAEKNGLEKCKKDWYPKHIEVQQEGTAITVTFNLAPPQLGIRSYFSLCYANSMKKYTDISPNFKKNQTHHSFQMNDLQEGTNYTCEIAADQMDAVRKTFNVQVLHFLKAVSTPHSVSPSLALMLPLGLSVAVIFVVLVAALIWKTRLQMKKVYIKPDIIRQQEESGTQEGVMPLPRNRPTPPRLLICYSSCDGPAHVKAVMQLGAFIQQHMATQVCLDLWDSLSVAEEGGMAWHCRQIRESDFILVICSWGLNRRSKPSEGDEDDGADEGLHYGSNAFCSKAAVKVIGEEVGHAKARGQDLSKYMAAIFDYSDETDIPTELRLVSHYILTRDLQLLFSHLHGVALHGPGHYLKINHISEDGFTKLPSGAALQWAIYEARMEITAKRHDSVGSEGD